MCCRGDTGARLAGVLLVDPGGLPQEFGDEPLLMARKLQAPVMVGEDRYEAGLFAEARFGPQIHLLDDGFQHRALARDFDIVLVTPQDASDRLLPAGRLAGAVVFVAARRCGCAGQRRFGGVVSAGGKTGVASAARNCCRRMFRRGRWSFAALRGRRILCCSCGRRTLNPWRKRSFAITMLTLRKIFATCLQLKQRSEAGGFVTTEKDAVNLGGYLSALAPLAVVPVKMELADAANAVDTMLRTIEERRRRS